MTPDQLKVVQALCPHENTNPLDRPRPDRESGDLLTDDLCADCGLVVTSVLVVGGASDWEQREYDRIMALRAGAARLLATPPPDPPPGRL